MKPKTMILMVVAVVCGLGASYLTSQLLAERQEQPAVQVVEIPKVKILVAKKFIPQGDIIKSPKDVFVEKEFAKESVPQEALKDLKDLQGKTLRRAIRKDVWVTAEDLVDGPLTLDVPPGHRAIGVRVTLDSSASGFASLPGSRVDIIWNRKGNSDDHTFSKMILQNVLVLAADTTDINQTGARAVPASVVTLALSPEDARCVSMAAENGSMRLVLRPPGDDKILQDDTSRLSDLVRARKDEPKVEEPAPPPAAPEVVAAIPPVTQDKWEPLPFPREDNRRMHVVWIQQAGRQWKEVFWLDDQGNVIEDDVQRHEAAGLAVPPPPPPAPPRAPAARGAAKNN